MEHVEMEPPSMGDPAQQEQAESSTNPQYTYSMSSKKCPVKSH